MNILIYLMVQLCSRMKVLSIFFKEPTKIHFIKEISKRINLAPTSVRKYIKEFLKEGIIIKKESSPFNGFVANRESDDFIYYKRIYNIYSLKKLVAAIVSTNYPKAIVLFGSYSRGEDIESSDIDLVIISKSKLNIDLTPFEKELEREINIIKIDSLNKLDNRIIKKINNGIVLYGEV
jgi:predicted nucleotidyltransferase/predicted transcriptional regulator